MQAREPVSCLVEKGQTSDMVAADSKSTWCRPLVCSHILSLIAQLSFRMNMTYLLLLVRLVAVLCYNHPEQVYNSLSVSSCDTKKLRGVKNQSDLSVPTGAMSTLSAVIKFIYLFIIYLYLYLYYCCYYCYFWLLVFLFQHTAPVFVPGGLRRLCHQRRRGPFSSDSEFVASD